MYVITITWKDGTQSKYYFSEKEQAETYKRELQENLEAGEYKLIAKID